MTDMGGQDMPHQPDPLGDPVVADYLALMDDSAVAVLPHALRIASELGVPAALAGGPATVDVLGGWLDAAPQSLYRLLRALTSVGFLTESPTRTFALTSLGTRLLPGDGAGVAESVHNLESCRAWHDGAASIRSGGAVFASVHGDNFFAHKDTSLDAGRAFLRRMRERASRLYPRIAEAIDWRPTSVVMDIGGGDASVLTRILRHAPHLTGVLFDRTPVIEAVKEAGTPELLPDRLNLSVGDFFETVMPGADTHLLCSVLHDWTDDEAVAILRNSRRALSAGGRLLIVEMVVPDGDEPHPSKWSDLGMMILTGGRERTLMEFTGLLTRAGYGLSATYGVPGSFFSVLEANWADSADAGPLGGQSHRIAGEA
jgi:hypothetical protein